MTELLCGQHLERSLGQLARQGRKGYPMRFPIPPLSFAISAGLRIQSHLGQCWLEKWMPQRTAVASSGLG